MKRMIKTPLCLLGLLVLVFVVNYSWSHALFASTLNRTECPEGLKSEAREEVSRFFGSVKAKPIIACLAGPVLGLNVEYGTTRFAPLFRPIIVLGPKGFSKDVASHEYMHAEFAKRTSVLLRTYRVPTWFDEGLAMQLDHRNDFGRASLRSYMANIKPTKLADMASPRSFYLQGQSGKTNYAFSRCIIEEWLKTGASSKVLKLIDEIRWLNTFPIQTFTKFEETCSSQ